MTRHLHTHRFSQRGQLHSKVPLFIQITTSCYQRDEVPSLYLHRTTQTADILTMNTTQSHPRWRNKVSCHWKTLWIKESEIYTQGHDAQGVIMMLLVPYNLQMNHRGMIFLYCLQHIMMRHNTVIICWTKQSVKKKTSKKNLHERPRTIWESVNTCWQSGTEEQTRRWCMRQILPMMKWQLSHLHWLNKTRTDHTQTQRHICCATHPPTQTCVYTQRHTHTT